MSFKAYIAEPFGYLHECVAFDDLVIKLKNELESSRELNVLIGNPSVNGREIDAIFIDSKSLSVIDFKNYGGTIHFSENGPWFADEKEVRGGNQENPYRQIRANKFALLDKCKQNETKILINNKDQNWGHISGFALFQGEINFDESIPEQISRWFQICDLNSAARMLVEKHSNMIRLNKEEIKNFVKLLNLRVQQLYPGNPDEILDETIKEPVFAPIKLLFHDQAGFRESLNRLRTRGGAFQQARTTIIKCIEKVQNGSDPFEDLEQQNVLDIKDCFKYKLNDSCFITAIRRGNLIILGGAGSQEEVLSWVSSHKGMTYTIDSETGRILTIIYSDENISPELPAQSMQITAQNAFFGDSGLFPELNVQEIASTRLIKREILKLGPNSSNDDIEDIIEAVEDSYTKSLIKDLISLLRKEDIEGASARLKLQSGEACPAMDVMEVANRVIESGANSDSILVLNELEPDEIERLFNPDKFFEWMLFLHPDQKKIVDADYDKPTILTGVSGSGKTCVLVHRAKRLAKKYPKERIGILTLNRSLSHLIKKLLDQLCGDDIKDQIEVMAVYDYFSILVKEFGCSIYLDQLNDNAAEMGLGGYMGAVTEGVQLGTFAREFDPLSGERLKDTWVGFCNEPDVATSLAYLQDYLNNFNTFAPDYLHEEFSLVRSAFSLKSRSVDYKKMERHGRAIPFKEEHRKEVLRLLIRFEEYLLAGGLLDDLSLTQAIQPSWQKIRKLPKKLRYRCLLIDEFQDLSTMDLALFRYVPTDDENGLFVTGDPVQRVLVKSLKMASAGLDLLTANRVQISKNFRNSRQILEAASMLANVYSEKANSFGENIERLDPELAQRETAIPAAYNAGGTNRLNSESEISKAWELANECLQSGAANPWSICIATASTDMFPVDNIIDWKPVEVSAEARHLTGDYVEHKKSVSVATISDVKGFEFSMVIIVGCSEDQLPRKGMCEDEAWRDALRLYVAMTRARDQLCLLYTGEPSKFLLCMKDKISWN